MTDAERALLLAVAERMDRFREVPAPGQILAETALGLLIRAVRAENDRAPEAR